MRIAQVAPLAEAVPPKLYGGTERVVSWLTEELVQRGHDVTLFASADSTTSARLHPCAPHGLRLSGIRDMTASHLAMLAEVRRLSPQFDVIHFHTDLLQFALFRDRAHTCLSTLHSRLDLPDSMPIFDAFREMPLVSISQSQRSPVSAPANWLATIHHGLGPEVCPFNPRGGGYLAFLGRMSEEKRPDRAIEIAKRAGAPLKMAAKVDHLDEKYFHEAVRPQLGDPLIDFIGEISEKDKGRFLGGARALLFPIDWPEPFGLVMIEAMSAGTPVIAWRCGSIPEIIDHGESGFIVDSIEEAVEAVARAATLDRRRVRAAFERRFTAARMADDYVAAYEALLAGRAGQDLKLVAAE